MWALVTVAVIAALVAAAAPSLVTVNDMSMVIATANTLKEVALAVDTFNIYVKNGGPAFTTPHALSLLTTTVVNGQPAGCTAQNYNATAVTAWTTNGTFGSIWMDPGGLWTPLGRLNDLPSRTAATAATARTSNGDPYFIQIPLVDVNLARMLDMYVDGAANPAAGTVQYTTPPAADSTVLLSYLVTLAHSPAC